MAYKSRSWWVVLFIFLKLVAFINLGSCFEGEPKVPCFFIFGDSLVDSGNSNHLTTSAKANFLPYGIDFANGTTGRFTNGRTIVDFISMHLDLDRFIPPFAAARGRDILTGVNYASASAGIRDETGSQLGDRISFDRQLSNHFVTIKRMIPLLGTVQAAETYLNNCLYYVSFGGNDYINNYFLPKIYPTSHLFTPDQYAQLLIDQYRLQLKLLYNLGARKIALPGIRAIGNIPYAASTLCRNNVTCVVNINNTVELFNTKLVSLVDEFNGDLADSHFTYLNTSGMSAGGFQVANVGCCPTRRDGQCIPGSTPCPSREFEYAFWDAIHPTEAFNLLVAKRFYYFYVLSDVHPYDINHLVKL